LLTLLMLKVAISMRSKRFADHQVAGSPRTAWQLEEG